jgi:hypothetical protein
MPASPHNLSLLLAQARFQSALNTTFDLQPAADAPAVPLRLVEVNVRSAPKGYEQFAALFEGPAEPTLAQGTYTVSHPAFGAMPLFIVPVGRSPIAASYEVCVVRRVEDSPSNA